ncbi:hypothetical protein B0T14DRAFT_513648 [Immersiella caudata]|uniref:Rhodopsin domain-containing protein n=1 Tax=Immersiella caudata TaxID=314043 RepID=A0AA39WVD1_9PEZI|nr:hypothetical protein B0T14DRAFT_513648 [Immersiella caudata]
MTHPAPEPVGDPNVFFGQPIIAVAVLTILLSTFTAGLRVWSRAVILRIFALEDWFLLLGWFCATVFSAGNLAQLQTGLGRTLSKLSPGTLTIFLKLAWSMNIIYAVALTSVKISILCLYLRALRYSYVTVATKALLVIVILTHMWIIASLFTVCVPLEAFWDRTKYKYGSTYCHTFDVYWSHAGINIVTDFLIFMLPLTVLRKVRIPKRQQIALGGVFVLAFLVCIISLVRTLQFIHGLDGPTDRGTVIKACWTMAEVHITVICACLTTINPVLSRWFPRLWSVESDQTTKEEGQGVDTIGHARRHRGGTEDTELSWASRMRTSESKSERSSTVRGRPASVELAVVTEPKDSYRPLGSH